ncbi:hypothetical protein Z517_09151 [Fonsecaea pedrosoi CBS 271.37]|uniref:Unplaced genomic scaffold supercont1.6, whole genome shotgun sequence n=1 Tax=Fonsecaea pedrosoi CBS 271.37 TaxID=1442368 RepID=A0A0D2ER08_9EURO|nr:uncharacterized protein Z517_09151 [Fonsecaea pedrosoi CBS 271.37]KIW76707.1 hypothetical protein Z517_09151 [Fonsecaea pedrosoi CBS 271.37]
MAEPGGSNQDKAQRPQMPVGEPLDQTPRAERLRRGLALHEAVMGVEPPRRRLTGLTPVARDKFGVPLVMSNLPQKKAGARKRRIQRQQQQQQQQQQQTRNQQHEQRQSAASIAPSRPSTLSSAPAPALVAGPAAPAMSMSLPATARAPAHMSTAPKPTRTPGPLFATTQTQKTRHDTPVSSDFVGHHGNKKVKTTTTTAASDDTGNVVGVQNPVGGARSDDADGRKTKGNSGNVTKGPRQQSGAEQQPGKLTLISAEQLHDLRADLVQSARENSDLRHEVEVLEQRLAQTEEERQTYWACGMEWARRERALVLEMEFWREQARSAATTTTMTTTTTTEHYPDDMGDVDNTGAIGGPVQYGFIGGGYFGDNDNGHGHGPAQQTGLGTEYAFDTDFAAGFGAGPGAGPGADPWTGFDDAGFGAGPATGTGTDPGTGTETGTDCYLANAAHDADELDKERDVMLRMD